MNPCPYCTYDLEGLDEPERCPECGRIVNAAYLRNLMNHRISRDEQFLYKAAMVGWVLHMAGFFLLGALLANVPLAVVGALVSALLLGLTILAASRARKTWPKRFAFFNKDIDMYIPRGFLFVIAAWALPVILIFGLLAGI